MKKNFARIHLDSLLNLLLDKLPIKSGKLLIIGCGNQNRYIELFKNFTVDGVDLLQNLNKNIPYTHHVCDASKLPFKDNNFDIIIALETFEHIDDNVNAMKVPTNKKKFYKLFTSNSSKIKAFVKENKLNIKQRKDILKALEYYASL